MHVFTYGTLMFPEVWQAVVGREFATVTALAAGFAVFRVRDAEYPGLIAADANETVPGVVYFDVDADSLRRLDAFESDFYCRLPIDVKCDDGRSLSAEAYVVPPEFRDVLTAEPWTRDNFAARGDLARFVARYAGFDRLGDAG